MNRNSPVVGSSRKRKDGGRRLISSCATETLLCSPPLQTLNLLSIRPAELRSSCCVTLLMWPAILPLACLPSPFLKRNAYCSSCPTVRLPSIVSRMCCCTKYDSTELLFGTDWPK